MNVDSSVSNSRSRATIGGVVRRPNGSWMGGYRQVEIESDNSVLIVVIQNGLVANNCYTKVRLIQDWCFEDWEEKF
ncbi:hypothetical protein Goari_005909 [Gossypium aridum]|uniref:RNase H type-1 domain-containing protein n=1 Tax=Gossypium aridum TaxID=34290 RepID=A0A7J8XLP0_GOSAI|nr:hypothetical protein [Gossypium aridum]